MIKIFQEKRNLPVIILAFLYFLFVIITWGKWGHVISDSFREAIIPQAMLNGDVLYRDITNLYPPFAYQINALLFKIFGCNLNVLYLSAVICGFVILTFLYKLFQKFSSDLIAFICCLTIMEFSTFRICIYNSASWFFPYSYSFIYAFCFCILAIYMYFIYRENKFSKDLFLSALFIGLSIACKWDFLLFAIFPVFTSIKTKSVKQILSVFGLIILPSFLSVLVYLFTGGSVCDLVNQIHFLVNFSHSPSVIEYNKIMLQQVITVPVLLDVLRSFVLFIKDMIIIGLVSYLFVLCCQKVENKILKVIIGFFTLIISYLFVLIPFSAMQFKTFGINKNLVFIPYLLLISMIFIFVNRYKKHQVLSYEEKFFGLLLLVSFVITYRQCASVMIAYVGNWTILLYWSAFVYLLLKLIPQYFQKLDNDLYKKSVSLALIAFCSLFSIIYFTYFLPNYNNKIVNEKGVFYTTVAYSRTINDTLNYIEKNIPKDKKVLVLEEGLIFNWFTDRKTDMKYYALIPHMIDTWGEENVVNDLKNRDIDYVLITNNKYPFVGNFGIYYAKNITNYLFENYSYEKSIVHSELPKSFEVTVLKRK